MKNKKQIFPIALLIYALVALVAIAIGLGRLWDYAASYQMSLPNTAKDAYMQQLTPEYVADRCDSLYAQIDGNLQNVEDCRKAVLAALTEEFTCAKKVPESTDSRYVYTIRCGATVIGAMEMERMESDNQGLGCWQVTKERFDMSHLLSKPVSITVPDSFTVSAFGKTLDESYITKRDIPFSLLKDFYKTHTLPSLVTYTAGPFLGDGALTACNEAGTPVDMEQIPDVNSFLDNCTLEEKQKLDVIIRDFITGYMDYTNRNGGDTPGNLSKLRQYVVSDGSLYKDLRNAMSSFQWIDDRHAVLQKVVCSSYVNVGNGQYYCDISYTIEADVLYDRTTETKRMQVIFQNTQDGLKAQAMLLG